MELELPPEDEYVHLMAHACKAWYKGVGLRVLADVIIMNQTFGDSPDCEYIREQLDAVMHMMECSTYSTEAEGERIRLRRSDEEWHNPRLAELRRFFSFDIVRDDEWFVTFERHRWLRPLFPFARIFGFARRALSDPRDQLTKIAALLGGARGK